MAEVGHKPRPLQFYSKIEIEGINPYVHISPQWAAKLRPEWRKPMPVLVRINGAPEKPWRINLMPKGEGVFFLYLHGQVRKASSTEVGSRVLVEIAFDEKYQPGPGPMPAYLKLALKANPKAASSYHALSQSRQKELVRYFLQLKGAETKARNLEKALRVLSGEPGRFMARDWKSGR